MMMHWLLAMALASAPATLPPPIFSAQQTGEVRFPLEDAGRGWLALGNGSIGQQFDAEFIRATVAIERSTSAVVAIRVTADDPSAFSRLTFQASWSPEHVRMIDVYPGRGSSIWADECLPPSGEHGDFWVAPTHLKITLRLPAGMRANVRVRDGSVIDHR